MDYELTVDPDAGRRIPKPLPEELREQLRAAFRRIAADPKKVGKPPVSPPYAPGGWVYEFHADVNGARYYLAIFYEVDDAKHQVGVTFVSVRAPYDPKAGPHLPQTPSCDCIEIPRAPETREP